MNKYFVFITGLILFFSLLISACGHKGDPQPPEGEVKPPKAKAYGSR
jgi:predicted small lipoprotein YifL